MSDVKSEVDQVRQVYQEREAILRRELEQIRERVGYAEGRLEGFKECLARVDDREDRNRSVALDFIREFASTAVSAFKLKHSPIVQEPQAPVEEAEEAEEVESVDEGGIPPVPAPPSETRIGSLVAFRTDEKWKPEPIIRHQWDSPRWGFFVPPDEWDDTLVDVSDDVLWARAQEIIKEAEQYMAVLGRAYNPTAKRAATWAAFLDLQSRRQECFTGEIASIDIDTGNAQIMLLASSKFMAVPLVAARGVARD